MNIINNAMIEPITHPITQEMLSDLDQGLAYE